MLLRQRQAMKHGILLTQTSKTISKFHKVCTYCQKAKTIKLLTLLYNVNGALENTL